ncbi:MAG: hypothetical protein E7231_02335 [Cellulosilyticum sp.]|nr:hypothetical protein [Cellulosilyticum sp.]
MKIWKKAICMIVGLFLSICTVGCVKQKVESEWAMEGEPVFHSDLVFHILNYINFEGSPANMYSKEYIDEFENFRSKQSNNDYKLIEEAQKLSVPYMKYFNEVSNVAFIGFYASSYEELKDQLNSMSISKEAKEEFIKPFIQCMDAELSIYTEYWDRIMADQKNSMDAFISYSNKTLCALEKVFKYANKKPHYYFCVSLGQGKGRGIWNNRFVSAAGCIPKSKSEQQHAFFQAFHEMTHQITDRKLFTHISMEDGTHLLSEKVVMKTDYYLIQRLDEDLLEDYIRWIAWLAGISEISEQDFLDYYKLPDKEEKEVQKIIDEISNIS